MIVIANENNGSETAIEKEEEQAAWRGRRDDE